MEIIDLLALYPLYPTSRPLLMSHQIDLLAL